MTIKPHKMMSIFVSLFLTALCSFLLYLWIPLITQISQNYLVANPTEKYFFQENLLAQEKPQQEEPSKNIVEEDSPFPVIFDGETLFEFKTNLEGLTNQERAKIATKRIKEVAEDRSIDIEQLSIRTIDGVYVIQIENNILLPLINADAEANDKSLEQLAQEYSEIIKNAILQYRERRSLSYMRRMGLLSLFFTIFFVFIVRFLNWFVLIISRRILEDRIFIFRPLRIQDWILLSVKRQKQFTILVFKIVRLIVIFFILYFYIPLLLSIFPKTQHLSRKVFSSFFEALGKARLALIAYLPNLFLIIITLIITYYLIRLCHPLFKSIEEERITITGFYPDWANPTYKLTIILIVGVAIAIIFPYLPGSNSPSFRAISILLGVVVTFGGANTITNLVGGFVVIYTRAFQIGDHIKTDKYQGVVIEKNILSTRICNGNNEIITIPNSILVSSQILNYSAMIRERQSPLVLDINIKLGCDFPLQLVHETLVDSALNTDNVLDEPAPYVWQTSLENSYITYRLRVYTNKTNSVEIGDIYSKLYQNIQNKCAEANIKIQLLKSGSIEY